MEELVLKTYVASLCKTNENEHALFTPDINYSIPGYQRPYEWSNEKIENMMSSLLDFYQEGIKSYNKDALLFGTIQLNVIIATTSTKLLTDNNDWYRFIY